MKIKAMVTDSIVFLATGSVCIQEQDGKEKTEKGIERRVNAMSLEEKIAKSLCLISVYWNTHGRLEQGMTTSDAMVALIIRNNFISGVILFANNLKASSQIVALTSWYAAIKTRNGLHLFIAIDNYGGIKFRFPSIDRLRKDVFDIDIVPYKQATDNHITPNMIMTAYI